MKINIPFIMILLLFVFLAIRYVFVPIYKEALNASWRKRLSAGDFGYIYTVVGWQKVKILQFRSDGKVKISRITKDPLHSYSDIWVSIHIIKRYI